MRTAEENEVRYAQCLNPVGYAQYSMMEKAPTPGNAPATLL